MHMHCLVHQLNYHVWYMLMNMDVVEMRLFALLLLVGLLSCLQNTHEHGCVASNEKFSSVHFALCRASRSSNGDVAMFRRRK